MLFVFYLRSLVLVVFRLRSLCFSDILEFYANLSDVWAGGGAERDGGKTAHPV